MTSPGQERPDASDEQLSRRAIAAYYRSPATPDQTPNRSDVRDHEGRRYVVLSAHGQVLAVYRVRNDGMLKLLTRWPAELQTTPGRGVSDGTQTGSLEDQAEQIARQIAVDTAQSRRLPVDPGHINRLAEIVRTAQRAGHDAAMREVLDAWHLFTEADEDSAMDTFVEQLGDIAGPAVLKEMKKGRSRRPKSKVTR